MIICGLGGQGILYAMKVLEYAAMQKGENVIGCETHGMAQRGGSVISHFQMGGFRSPLVREGTADFVIAFEKTEAMRNIGFLRKGGTLFANASGDFPLKPVKEFAKERGIEIHSFDASERCLQQKLKTSLNVMLLGFCAGCEDFPFGKEEIGEAVTKTSPPPVLDSNLKAFEEGLKCAR
jgi:indolepyruvate ferredoxin oxidoreductase beta subunit